MTDDENHPIDQFCRRLRLADDLLSKLDDGRVKKYGKVLLLVQIAHLHERALEEAKALVASGESQFSVFVPELEKIEAHKQEWLRQAVEAWRASQPRH